MKAQLKAWAERIDALALRERMLVFLAILGAMWWGWDRLLMTPLDAERSALERRVPQVRDQIRAVHDQIREVAAARTRDPDAAPKRELARLRAENQRVGKTLAQLANRLVPPDEMARVLEAVLEGQRGLELQRLEGLGAEPLIAAPGGDAAAAGAETAPNVYRHGLRLVFTGSYLDTLAYLKALEALPWSFLWGEIRLRVEEYPTAEVSLTVYSLSFDDAWIGA